MEFAASDQEPRIVEASAPAEAVGEPEDTRAAPEEQPDGGPSPVAAAFAAPGGTEWSRVSGALGWYRCVLLLAGLVPAAALGGAGLWLWVGWPWAAGWWGVCAVALVVGWLVAGALRRSWGYAEGRTDFYLTYGVLVRQLLVVPYGRMQVVDVTSNLLEQALGIATVRVRTAATTVDTRLPGLRLNDAVVLRDRLAAKSETFSTGL